MLLLFTLAVPPVTAFLFESGLDFETGCYASYIKKKAINCFASTFSQREKNFDDTFEPEKSSCLYRCFGRCALVVCFGPCLLCFGRCSLDIAEAGTKQRCTKVSDQGIERFHGFLLRPD